MQTREKQTVGQALYRKYRSRSFDEVAGQGHITKTLANAVKQGKISHAYLLTGPRGTGKTSIARILAHEINQLPYSDKPHLDIIEIDAASNRRIEDIRDLREKVHIAPTSAPYKVYIIDEVHMLTSESFNALLKTLEEPPAHVVFILATTELHKLPATITSRAQRFAFRAPSVAEITAQLQYIAEQEQIKIDEGALALIAEHAEGSFRDSISLLDQISGSFETKQTISETDVSTLLGLPPTAMLQALLEATLQGKPTEVALKLAELDQTGTSPVTIALSLIKRAAQEASANPPASQLLQALIDVGRSAHPQAKLLAELLIIAHQKSDMPAKKYDSKALRAATENVVVAKTLPAKKQPPTAELSTPEPIQKKQVVAQSKASLEIITSNWGTILARVKSHSPPLYGALKTAEVRFENGSLALAFKYALHRKRVNDSKHKSALAAIIAEAMGLDNLSIETMVDATATPTTPIVNLPKSAEAEAVIGVMGGGEIVRV